MNPANVIELMNIAAQLFRALNEIKKQAQEQDPELWRKIADDYNAAAAAFNGEG